MVNLVFGLHHKSVEVVKLMVKFHYVCPNIDQKSSKVVKLVTRINHISLKVIKLVMELQYRSLRW